MKRFLLAGTVLALCGPPVSAQAAGANYVWTGCYVGGQLGAAWARNDISNELPYVLFAPFNTPIGVDPSPGFLGGAQVGCDYQFAANWVAGVAGDFSWTNIDGQTIDPFFGGKFPGTNISLQAKTEWMASATARLGYAWDRWMFYGKGGAAWAHNRYSVNNVTYWGPAADYCNNGLPVGCAPTGTDTRVGWTLGVGLAWAFMNGWSAGIEYDHYDFGTHDVTLTDPNGYDIGGPIPLAGPVSVKQQIEVVKVMLDYRFGMIP